MILASKWIADNIIIAQHLNNSAKDAVLDHKIDRFYSLVKDKSVGDVSSVDVTDEILTLSVSKFLSTATTSPTVGVLVNAANDFNFTIVKKHSTNDYILDNDKRIHGYVTSTPTIKAGTFDFTNGSTTVTATSTASLSAGMWIEGQDSRLYKIDSITDGTTFELTSAYQGVTAIISGINQQELTLNFFTYDDGDGSKTSVTLDVAVASINFLFAETLTLKDAPYGALTNGLAFAEPLPVATPPSTDRVVMLLEKLTVTGNDTVSSLSVTPFDTIACQLSFGGLATDPENYSVSPSGAITIESGMPVTIEPGDLVVAFYPILESLSGGGD